MYSTYKEGKSAVAERFIRTLKNKISKHMTAIQQNIYFDVLNDIVDKYNNLVHKTIKVKPNIMLTQIIIMLNIMKFQIKKILNLNFVTMLEFRNIKTSLLKDILQIGQKKFLLLIELKIQFLELMVLVIWMVKKLLENFIKKNCKKLIKKNLE